MLPHPKIFAIAFLWVFCVIALPGHSAPSAANPADELKSQIDALPTIEAKLDFLKTGLKEQSVEVKAALGAAVIQSAPEANQKDVALNVAQILAGLKNGASDSPKLAGLLTFKLPDTMAASLAGSIAIGAGTSDPDKLPQIAAAVIVAIPSTIKAAGAIAEEVMAFAPLNRGTSIATAIASKYADYPQLVQQAPKMAAGMTHAMLPKGTIEVTRPEIASTVAALTVLLPGSIRSNKELITKIGQEVAALISDKYSGMATTIVGITSATLKSAAGNSDIEPVLYSFRDTFKDSIDDPIIQQKLDTVVSDVNSGVTDKGVKPLEPPITSKPPSAANMLDGLPLPTDLQYRPAQSVGYASKTDHFSYGTIETPETNVVNR